MSYINGIFKYATFHVLKYNNPLWQFHISQIIFFLEEYIYITIVVYIYMDT